MLIEGDLLCCICDGFPFSGISPLRHKPLSIVPYTNFK